MKKKVQVRVPATSANLGSGFDCVGIALGLYNTFTAERAAKSEYIVKGLDTETINTAGDNLFWQSANALWQKTGTKPVPLKVVCEVKVPPARGLGSSSTAVVGGLLVANALVEEPLSQFELMELATELEGHPDNVAPALCGGVSLSVITEEGLLFMGLDREPDFSVVVAIPDILVETEKARNLLPETVSRQDAIYNASRVGLLTYALSTGDYDMLAVAMQDRLHQRQRAVLIPGLLEALESALDVGAYGAALSGSGPTVLALCPAIYEDAVAIAMVATLAEAGLDTYSMFLSVDSEGAQYEDIDS
jgi:homoserine kinase